MGEKKGNRGLIAQLEILSGDLGIASIEDPAVIEHILKHLKQKAATATISDAHVLPPERAPPQIALFDSSQTRLFD